MTTLAYTIDAAKEASKLAANNTNLDIKSGACLISVEVQGACGESIISDSKSLIDGEVLDSELLSGTKLRWFPKEQLRFVSKCSAKARRALNQRGISFAKGATLVPISQLDDLIAELQAIDAEFKVEVEELKNLYDNTIEEHILNNQPVEAHIRKCAEEASKFASRFTFKIHPPMAIQPLFDGDEDVMTVEASQTLFEEISNEASEIYQKSFLRAERATSKKLKPVFALRDKLINLSFLDTSVARVAERFSEVLDELPKAYPLIGGDYHKVCHFLTLVSDQSKVLAYGQGGDDLSEQEEPEPTVDEDVSIDASSTNTEATNFSEDPFGEAAELSTIDPFNTEHNVQQEKVAIDSYVFDGW
ncbi:DUF3150 domain-containing protein [Pseudoalteromonas sp. SK20]|uniref:DUF3150 domain-containing protein n=1 Tax=Pseudoalteromonas sp. SK20 TaxID=1938367 RepID=UPI000975D3C3|nr:DUF3150 domain-containing protein [Pseudoalteromonas sp. SK20]